MLLLSSTAYSQTHSAENESVSLPVTEPVNDEKAGSAKPVEAGPGGDIKLEGKRRTRAESMFDWHAHLHWENRYVTEGRDNLSGKGLVSISSEFAWDGFSVIPWIADSPAADYSEFNLNIIYGTRLLKNIEIYAGYNHIQTRDSGIDTSDNEISLDLAYTPLKHFYVLASVYHSFEADGSFMELTVKKGHPIDKNLHLSVRGILGANAGYVSDGHDGLNHFQVRSTIAYHSLKQMEIYAYAGYNRAIDRDATRYAGDELLDNFFLGGIGITYRF